MKNFEEDLHNISACALQNQFTLMQELAPEYSYDFRFNSKVETRASKLIEAIREDHCFNVEQFLQKYSLSSEEGVAVMCLAEALIRIPDEETAKEFTFNKLKDKSWGKYIGFAKSRLVEISSIGLFTAGAFANLHNSDHIFAKIVSRTTDPLMVGAIRQAIKFLSKEFIIGYDIDSGLKDAQTSPEYLYSFDLLGESARTADQAAHYYSQYFTTIEKLKTYFPDKGENLCDRPNLSVKLTALYPRVEYLKWADIEELLIPKLVALLRKAKENNLTVSFDAEEARRLDIYLKVFTSLVTHPEFADYHGIGIVIQAYQKRALKVIDYVAKLAKTTGKTIIVRLVKGAYWDSEIKYAQENGLKDYPVFTDKAFTDAHYLAGAKKMFAAGDLIYPQFATHNAVTAATIIELADGRPFELQKLYGMGNSLYSELVKEQKVRIYAPIGKMADLLAYLMRRLLENGANTSFVNKVGADNIKISDLTKPLADHVSWLVREHQTITEHFLPLPADIYARRSNSKGIDLGYAMNIQILKQELAKFANKTYTAGSLINGREITVTKHAKEIFRPGNNAEKIGEISHATATELKEALAIAVQAEEEWAKTAVNTRADYLRKIADAMEANQYELYSLLLREAGKSINDAVNELREAVDFCRYYALQAEKIIQDQILPGPTGERNILNWHGRGTFLCISPWNFPLAIFCGQIVAALVTGNNVIAKPAEQTSLIANYLIKLMHQVGIPVTVLQLILASGRSVGEYLVTDNNIKGIVFTGSTATAKLINLSIAQRDGAIVPLIAETGGQNAMIVDSTALLEQVADDVITSAFYSAGQRCSALRVLYIQEEIYQPLLELIIGAMEELKIGDTIDITNDVGPVIDSASLATLQAHIADMQEKGFKLVASHPRAGQISGGNFFHPYILEVNSINDIPDEKFGPILHIAKYKAADLEQVISDINNYGFGLTFGIHSRNESKIEEVRSKIKAGNIYANRSIIGAQVESHPFGGENKSGTGFKAGGPHYLLRFMTERALSFNLTAIGGNVELLKREEIKEIQG